jgi:hypothetical protein
MASQHYAVRLYDITVAGRPLNIEIDPRAIVDSGSTFLVLPPSVYNVVVGALRSAMPDVDNVRIFVHVYAMFVCLLFFLLCFFEDGGYFFCLYYSCCYEGDLGPVLHHYRARDVAGNWPCPGWHSREHLRPGLSQPAGVFR